MTNRSWTSFWNQINWRKVGWRVIRLINWCVLIGVVLGFVAVGVLFGYLSAIVKEEPVRDKEIIMQQVYENIVTGFVYFNDDTPVGQLRTEEDRRLATYSEIPQKIIDATLAIEDSSFYQHHGVDFNGIFRAVFQKLTQQDVQTGGSTITQQLARRVFLSLDREVTRKFKEILLSLRLERLLSKDEILLAYLNKIPYGNGSSGYNLSGIKAAAKGIFNVPDLNQLNIAQAAYLAGLPQLPSKYSAYTSKGELDPKGLESALIRQRLVLKRMHEENKITTTEYKDALAFDIKASLAPTQKKAYSTYPFLMLEAEREAAELIVKAQYPNLVLDTQKKRDAYNEAIKDAREELMLGGYQIYTTINKSVYDSMQAIAADKKNFTPDDPKKGIEQVGAIMLDNRTSAILGMIEGRDFYAEQMNHATQAYRQPGSTMKPIAAYIPAIENGAIQPATIIDDVPIILPDGQKGFHIPVNWDEDYHGLVSVRKAFNWSYNIPAIKVFVDMVGVKNAWDFTAKLGITSITKEDYQAQTGVIGGLTKGVTVKELTNAYTAVANKGVFNKAYFIKKIVDSNGKVVYEHQQKPTTVFSNETAYLTTDLMRTVVTEGTAVDIQERFKYNNKIAVAGKTGSTQDYGDVWFEAFTPDVTLGVWIGYDQPIHKLNKAAGAYTRAKSIWALVMNDTVTNQPKLFPTTKFERPDTIIDMTVSSVSGKLPNELTLQSNKVVTDIFNRNQIPTQEDDVMVREKYVSMNGINYIPQRNTPLDMIREQVFIRRTPSIRSILDKVEKAIEQLPEDKKKTIDEFIPLDMSDDAPSETDPRKEDGLDPKSPTKTALTKSGNVVKITFTPSTSTDVVGYRLYRATGKSSDFSRTGLVIFAGEDAVFSDKIDSTSVFSYYVAAVDVAGKESKSNTIVNTERSIIDLNLRPLLP